MRRSARAGPGRGSASRSEVFWPDEAEAVTTMQAPVHAIPAFRAQFTGFSELQRLYEVQEDANDLLYRP